MFCDPRPLRPFWLKLLNGKPMNTLDLAMERTAPGA